MIPSQQFTIWMVVLVGVPSMLAAFLAFVGVLLTRQNQQRIDTVHVQINHRMDELLEVTRSAAKAQGKIEGREAARAEKT